MSGWVYNLTRWILGAVFIYAGSIKAFHGLRSSLYRDLVMLAGIAFIYGWRRYRAIKPVNI